ncbi:unnamed protein product [Nezara viridula]|uniref:Uncharacterized protein n=1 Tax=Nezara viridula TaxID=85310 RepID=A0A9P0E710_NEZVI|nr:unnamed protein product [Nezara viridula]
MNTTSTIDKPRADYQPVPMLLRLSMYMGIPLLEREPPPLLTHIKVKDIISSSQKPLITLPLVPSYHTIWEALSKNTHNGFPIVGSGSSSKEEKGFPSYGVLKGLILRTTIKVLLKYRKVFNNKKVSYKKKMKLLHQEFTDELVNEPVMFTKEEDNDVLDLAPYMHLTPHFVHLDCSLSHAYHVFAALGLRHLVVVNNQYHPEEDADMLIITIAIGKASVSGPDYNRRGCRFAGHPHWSQESCTRTCKGQHSENLSEITVDIEVNTHDLDELIVEDDNMERLLDYSDIQLARETIKELKELSQVLFSLIFCMSNAQSMLFTIVRCSTSNGLQTSGNALDSTCPYYRPIAFKFYLYELLKEALGGQNFEDDEGMELFMNNWFLTPTGYCYKKLVSVPIC